jgi:hypothetical protein
VVALAVAALVLEPKVAKLSAVLADAAALLHSLKA